jgi:hypothetical protein
MRYRAALHPELFGFGGGENSEFLVNLFKKFGASVKQNK